MPMYDYACHACTCIFEDKRLIDERDAPLNEPCPNPECGVTGQIVRFLAGAPVFGRERGKTPEAFKDLLRRAKKAHRGSVINTDGI